MGVWLLHATAFSEVYRHVWCVLIDRSGEHITVGEHFHAVVDVLFSLVGAGGGAIAMAATTA